MTAPYKDGPGRGRGKTKFVCGPYGEMYDRDGTPARRLTAAGRDKVTEFMAQWPEPVALLRKVFPHVYVWAVASGVNEDDIEAACAGAIVETVLRWRPTQSGLSTAASWGMRAAVCQEIRSRARHSKEFTGEITGSDHLEYLRLGAVLTLRGTRRKNGTHINMLDD